MNKLKLLALGAVPFLFGHLISYAMMEFNWYGLSTRIIGVLFLVLWYWFGYKSYDWSESLESSVLLGNAFAIISVLLIMFQELILHRYMSNMFGYTSQMFFLPGFSITAIIESSVFFFIRTRFLWMSHCFCFIVMIALYILGYKKRMRGYNGR